MKYTLALIALLFAGITQAQEKITYLNEDGKSTKEKDAVLLEQRLKRNDTCWELNTYAAFGPRINSMQFRDEKGKIPNGRYLAYDRKGNCDTVGQYNNGTREGRWMVLSPKGRMVRELTYRNDRIVGKRDSTEANEESKKLTDSAAKAEGKTFTKVEIESEFPGGAAGWSDYLSHHLVYPKRAIEREIQGMPVVTFIVEKDGHVDPSNVYIEHSVEYTLDKEALRAITESPKWTPAVQDGRPVRSYKKQPFVFKLTK